MKSVAGLLSAIVAFASMPNDAGAGILQPTTYLAPAGHYALSVDPVERFGAGPANYILRKDGRTVWSGDRPFALADAVVTDDGIVGGYAYSTGSERADGEFVVAILDARGRTRLTERKPREGSHYLHTAADPKSNGLFLLAGRMVVRVGDPDSNAESESWWIYRLRDWHAEAKVRPRTSMPDAQRLVRVLDARPVNGTALVLVQWLLKGEAAADGSCGYGARFALLNRSGAKVWSTDLGDDYSAGIDDRAEARLLADMNEHGAILDTTHPGRFEVRQVATGERLGFAVARDAKDRNGWVVRVADRSAYVPEVAVKSNLANMQPLRMLGSVTLRNENPANASPIHDVWDFAVGGGHFAFIAGCDCESTEHTPRALTVIDGEGRLVRSVALPARWIQGSNMAVTDHVAWDGGDRWLVTTSVSIEQKTHSTAVRVDSTSGTITPIAGFDAPDIKALVPMADGGFLALTSEWQTYSSEDALQAFDARGALRWKRVADQPNSADLVDPEDIAVLPNGDVVVLENVGGSLKIHAPDGTFRRVIDLETAWGRAPTYPTGIAVDREGGVIVHDFKGNPPVVRMNLEGKVTNSFEPAYADGRKFDLHGNVKVDSNGRMWTSDGDALLRLDAHGKVDRVLGSRPDTDKLGSVAGFTATQKGTSYAVDERTGAVHSFDAQGRRVRVYHPDVGDYNGRLTLPAVTVSDAGDVYVERERGMGSRPEYVHYAPDGSRVGIESLGMDGTAQTWIAQPAATRRWVVAYDSVYLVDSAGTVVNRFERDAQRHWLLQPGPAAVAANGSLALLSASVAVQMAQLRSVDGAGTVALYSADGTPTEAWPAPSGAQSLPGSIAYDGQRLAFVASADINQMGTTVIVTDLHGKLLSRFKPDAAHPPRNVFFVDGNDGEELWAFDGKAAVVRYAMP
ncbi:MAG: hypothetical protein ABIO49_05055 [Dokdonella sp.]